MKLPRRNFLHLAAGAAALPVVSRIASAQAYPSRPVRLIGPYSPGGASDTVARLMGQWMSQSVARRSSAFLVVGAGAVVNYTGWFFLRLRCRWRWRRRSRLQSHFAEAKKLDTGIAARITALFWSRILQHAVSIALNECPSLAAVVPTACTHTFRRVL
jgi:hypothetical protein